MRQIQLLALACLVAAPLAARVEEGAQAPKAQVIVGCKETKMYHRADCKWVKEIEKAGTRVDFKTVAEAKKAGMKPCGDCKPK
jgi:methylphosphotriester-DNA--protein-cysteine methyltransferase